MADDDNNVTPLGVRFKKAEEDRVLLLGWEVHSPAEKCFHSRFIIDPELEQVECAKCHERLNPMWVLQHLATTDIQFRESRKRYMEEMRRIDERSRTKCEHCGQMTRISRR